MSKNKREFKGISLLELPDTYSIIDIETTGLDTTYDFILEISAIKVKNNKIVDSFSSFVKCFIYVPEFITELTGITTKMVENAPLLKDVLEKFLDFIGQDTLVGHNINFDINFLYDNCINELNKPLTNNFVDTLRLSRRVNCDLKHHRLIDLLELYEIDASNQHRALNDCKYTFEIYNNMKQKIIKEHGTIDNLNKSSKILANLRAKDIKPTTQQYDIDNPLYNKQVVFTGTLAKINRKSAMQLVVNIGGFIEDTVTKNTNFLVLGIQDYKKIKGNKSNKVKKAEEYILNGQDLKIISENVFYDILNVE